MKAPFESNLNSTFEQTVFFHPLYVVKHYILLIIINNIINLIILIICLTFALQKHRRTFHFVQQRKHKKSSPVYRNMPRVYFDISTWKQQIEQNKKKLDRKLIRSGFDFINLFRQ
jgi:hypothetical protein